jgi:DNA polymerase (family 10)
VPSTPSPDWATLDGLDDARARVLRDRFGVTSASDLDLLARTNRLRDAEGFGPEVQARLLAALRRGGGWGERRLLDAARGAASRLLGALQREPTALRLAVAGGVRRMEPVCDGVDLVATSTDPAALLEAFATVAFAAEVLERGPGFARVRLEDGSVARLDAFADDDRTLVALAVRTGPDDYVEALRSRAAARGWTLGADALLGPDGQRAEVRSEEEVFQRVGVPWRPPETRRVDLVDRAVAEDLVRMTDLRGVFHAHTRRGHGSYSAAEMAARAAREGYAWIALTDRARPDAAPPLVADDLRALRDAFPGTPAAPAGEDDVPAEPVARVLAGVEVAIRPDGTLDAEPGLLEAADVVVAVADAQGGEDVTARLCRAVRDPRVHVLGRPQGRVLLGRPGPAVDVPAVLDACAASGTAVEIDGDPHRLDLGAEWHEEALRRGLVAVVAADAHDLVGIDHAILATGQARRGEWPRDRVLTTWSADDVRTWCRRKRDRGP